MLVLYLQLLTNFIVIHVFKRSVFIYSAIISSANGLLGRWLPGINCFYLQIFISLRGNFRILKILHALKVVGFFIPGLPLLGVFCSCLQIFLILRENFRILKFCHITNLFKCLNKKYVKSVVLTRQQLLK